MQYRLVAFSEAGSGAVVPKTLRPIEPLSFPHLAILSVASFVFLSITLLYVVFMYPTLQFTSVFFLVATVNQPDSEPGPGLSVWAERGLRADVAKYSSVLSNELSRYPLALFDRIGLRRIVICSSLTFNNRERGGGAAVAQGTIYLRLPPSAPGQELFLPRAIHHELFHFFDVILTQAPGADRAWAKLNPQDFTYGGDEILEALDVTNEHPDQRAEVPGLLNNYSMVSAQEDRAELFSTLMVSPDALRKVAGEDEILRKKIEYLKRELLELSPDFDAILPGGTIRGDSR